MNNFESNIDEMNETIATHFYDSIYGGDKKDKKTPSKKEKDSINNHFKK